MSESTSETSTAATATTAAPPPANDMTVRGGRTRRWLAWTLLVLGCLVLLVGNVAVFARTFLFDTDTFADALAPEQPDEDVIAGVADALSDQIVNAADVQERIQELTPRDNALVAATVADGAENVIDDTVRAVLQSDPFRAVWRDVVVRAHDRFVVLIEDDDRQPVLLDLRPAVERVDQRLEDRGIDVIDDGVVNEVGEVMALRRSQVDDLRGTVDLVRRLVIVLPIVAIVLIAAAVALATDRRRMLARAGVGVVIAMFVTALALRIARRTVIDRVEVDVRQQAVDSLWDRLFETLFQQTAALAAIGLVVALGAWLAGPSRFAAGLRARVRSLGPADTGESATAPSGVARLLGAHRSGVRLGILTIAAGVLLLLPGLSALAIVVVAGLALAAIVGAEIMAAAPPRPAA
jgi:hypothetical protein